MKKQMTILLIVVGMLISAGGCATIMNGTTDTVHISSIPPDAKFSVISVTDSSRAVISTGTTPQNVVLQRKTDFLGNSYVVDFEKSGYLKKSVSMKKTISGWYFGNILFGGIPGLIIDSISGAADDLHNVSVRLVPVNRWEWDNC